MTEAEPRHLHAAEDGIPRCRWAGDGAIYRRYHDDEWGHPVGDDTRLFEKICLEGFQCGLSWLTILRKREAFREAFATFDFARVARFDDRKDVGRLLRDGGIVRHRGKIEATIHNARLAVDLVEAYGSLSTYFWSWEPDGPEPDLGKDSPACPVPRLTSTSQALSRDLKKRGWKFVGPTTVYAFMQAMGMVNDHVEGCASRERVEKLRRAFTRPGRTHDDPDPEF